MAWKSLMAHDYAIAWKELPALAEKGYPEAWLYLGWMHDKGLGVPVSYAEAETCYNKSASLGSVEALYYLGRLHKENGAAEKSFDSFLKAVNMGYLPAIYWVGRAYLKGDGVGRDVEKAKVYIKKAVDAGNLNARLQYSRAQLLGVFGQGQRLSGLFGFVKAFASFARTDYSEPHSDRLK